MSIWKVTAAVVCGILFFTGGAAWAQASIPSDGKLKDGAVQPWYEQEAGRRISVCCCISSAYVICAAAWE